LPPRLAFGGEREVAWYPNWPLSRAGARVRDL